MPPHRRHTATFGPHQAASATGFKLGVPRRDHFRQLRYCPVAQRCEFFDVE
jgi:hypothetical protein